MLIAENSLDFLYANYGKHTVYTDGGTWYDEACNVLRLKHYLHSLFQKSLMERVTQYFKTVPRVLMTTIHVCKICNLFHVYNWIQSFVSMYNDTTTLNDYIKECDLDEDQY